MTMIIKGQPKLVPCQWCNTATTMLGTRKCDRCYELEKAITANPEIARLMLAHIDSEAAKAEEKRLAADRLKTLDDSYALEEELSALSGLKVLGIWPLWENDTYQTLVYGFNPGNSADILHRAEYGRYTRAELLAWATAKCAYRLTPSLSKEA